MPSSRCRPSRPYRCRRRASQRCSRAFRRPCRHGSSSTRGWRECRSSGTPDSSCESRHREPPRRSCGSRQDCRYRLRGGSRRVAGLAGDRRVARVDARVHRSARAGRVTAALDAGLVPRAGDGVLGSRVAGGAAARVDIGQQRQLVAVSALDRTEGLARDRDRLGRRVRSVRCIRRWDAGWPCCGSSRSRRSWTSCPSPSGTRRILSAPRGSRWQLLQSRCGTSVAPWIVDSVSLWHPVQPSLADVGVCAVSRS